MVRAFNSGGSFQGYTDTSAFGASDAMSTAVWYACAAVSSGRTSFGVWQLRTNSRNGSGTLEGFGLTRTALQRLGSAEPLDYPCPVPVQ